METFEIHTLRISQRSTGFGTTYQKIKERLSLAQKVEQPRNTSVCAGHGLLFALDINSQISQAYPNEHALIVFDLSDPTRYAIVKMPPLISGFEYDKTTMFETHDFSFEIPQVTVRYRQSQEAEWQKTTLKR